MTKHDKEGLNGKEAGGSNIGRPFEFGFTFQELGNFFKRRDCFTFNFFALEFSNVSIVFLRLDFATWNISKIVLVLMK